LAFIILGGSFIILIKNLLANTIGWIQRKVRRGLHQRLEWIESDTLQMQRMLFEEWGTGPWKGEQNAVPVTSIFGQKFSARKSIVDLGTSADMSDVSEPILITQQPVR